MKMKPLALAFALYLSGMGTLLFANQYSQKTYDNDTLLKASAAVGATADGSLIVDVGNGLMECSLVVDVSAMTIGADNTFRIMLQASPDATFGTPANIMTVGEIMLGGTGSGQGSADLAAGGRFMMGVRNERNGVTYRYLRIRTVVAGTAVPSITYSAWLAKP